MDTKTALAELGVSDEALSAEEKRSSTSRAT